MLSVEIACEVDVILTLALDAVPEALINRLLAKVENSFVEPRGGDRKAYQ
jgi:hypothetical protein